MPGREPAPSRPASTGPGSPSASGVATAALVAVLASPICRLFAASPDALEQATTYLRIAAAGIPGMLVVLATTGVLRGLQDTRTPLAASVLGFGSNIGLNLLFVYGFGWGIAGIGARYGHRPDRDGRRPRHRPGPDGKA